MAPKRSGSSSVTKQQSPAAQLNDRLKKNIPCSFEEWTKDKPDARADCEVQETYAQCIDLLGKLLHLEALLTRKQFRNWVRDVKDVKVRYWHAKVRHGLPSLPQAVTIAMAHRCERAIFEVTCGTCARRKVGNPDECVAVPIPTGSSNALSKCSFCRSRAVSCNWGTEIPAYMNRIKIAIHSSLDKEDDEESSEEDDERNIYGDTEGDAEGYVRSTDESGSENSLDDVGDDMEGVVEEGVGETSMEVVQEDEMDAIDIPTKVLGEGVEVIGGTFDETLKERNRMSIQDFQALYTDEFLLATDLVIAMSLADQEANCRDGVELMLRAPMFSSST